MSPEPTPETPTAPVCEQCEGTGYYGDNCAGIAGNREYVACECRGPQTEHSEVKLARENQALAAQLAQAQQLIEMAHTHISTFGAISGAPEEIVSQNAFFEAYHAAKKGASK